MVDRLYFTREFAPLSAGQLTFETEGQPLTRSEPQIPLGVISPLHHLCYLFPNAEWGGGGGDSALHAVFIDRHLSNSFF